MRQAAAFFAGSVLVAAIWLGIAICGKGNRGDEGPNPFDEIRRLSAEVRLIREELQNSTRPEPTATTSTGGAHGTGTQPVREQDPAVQSSAVEEKEPRNDAEARRLMALLWRCLRQDHDGVVSTLEANRLSPFDRGVTDAVERTFERLDALHRRFPRLNNEAIRVIRAQFDEYEKALKNADMSSRDRARLQKLLEPRGEWETGAADFETVEKSIMAEFRQELPTESGR
jgi:hypothetical protein